MCCSQHVVLSQLPSAGLVLTGVLLAVGARDPVVVALPGPQPASGSWALCRSQAVCSEFAVFFYSMHENTP